MEYLRQFTCKWYNSVSRLFIQRKAAIIMPVKKTNEEFIEELKNKKPSIKPLEDYTNSASKIKFVCLVCGNEWVAAPSQVLSGKGCPVCGRKTAADKRRSSREEFITKLKDIQPNIEVIGDYVNSVTKIEVRCKTCGNQWRVVPASLLRGTGCPKCNKRYRRNTEEFAEELKTISPHLSVIGEYINAHERIKVKCGRCGTEWMAEPNGLLKGNDCPVCGHSQTSVVEQILFRSFVLLVGKDNVINRDRKAIGKELDIYVKKLNLAVEFGAWYWHSAKIRFDAEKERLCEKVGIHLITIYEGCPIGTTIDELKNAVCYSNVISGEKDFTTIKVLILSLCEQYLLDGTIIETEWNNILKFAREESRKKDSEKFKKDLEKANNNIKYISGYFGSKAQVYVMCKTCGTKWKASSAYDLLHGHGCPVCGRQKANESMRMNTEEFKERMKKTNPHILVLGEYKNSLTGILCQCKKCKTKWYPKPANIINKRIYCPTCSPVTKLTNEEFLARLKNKFETIIPLEEYRNNGTPIRFKCQICGYEWKARPHDILIGNGCPKCAKKVAVTQEEFLDRIKKSNVEIIGEYKNTKTRIKCRCKVCGYEWMAIPSNLMRGAGCQKCAGTLKLTNKEFVENLSVVNADIKPLEQYVKRNEKILCRCKKCGWEWRVTPGNLLNGHGCPKCKGAKTKVLKSKGVICIETGVFYESVKIAKERTGITSISDCLHGRTKTAGGLHWVYANEQ